MINSLYAASAGMQVNLSKLDVISNNTANMDSPGYKKAVAVTSDFASALQKMLNGRPSPDQSKVGAYINEIKTDFSEGTMVYSGSQMDMCLGNEGFFTIQTPDGIGYSRCGSFATNGEGLMVTKNGNPVMGNNGPIKTGGYENITVSESGLVKGDGKDLDTLLIADFAKPYQMTRASGTLFYPNDPASATKKVTSPNIKQAYLESSNITNVSILTEMINMMDTNRQFEANQKVITTQDNILGRTVNELAKL